MAELSARPALSVGDRLKESLFYFPLILGGIILLALFLVVLFGPLLAPYNPYLIDRLVVPHYDFASETYIRVPVPPGGDYLLGTDERGMDIVSLLLFGARTTITAGVMIATLRMIIGLAAGMLMGWNENRWLDRFLQGAMNVITSVPALIAAMILIYAMGIRGGMSVFVIALTAVGWTEVAQYMRSEVLLLRKMPFMEGARVVGASDSEMLLRHIFPNILPQLFVLSFLEVGSVLMLVGELALVGVFIGGGSTLDLSDLMAPPTIIGIPTHPEWGASVASGFRWFRSYPHVVMAPAMAIFLSVLGFNAFGEGMRAFFEKRGVKATFLLGKRLLVVLGLAAAVVYLVMHNTRPSLWFQEMASGFQSARMLEDKTVVKDLWSLDPNAENQFPVVLALGERLGDYDFKGGIRFSNPVYARFADYFTAQSTPLLQSLDGEGDVISDYSDQVSYVVEDYGAAGDVTAPLFVIDFPRLVNRIIMDQLDLMNWRGRIVILKEGNAPPTIGQYLTERGAVGVIWIATEGDPLDASPLSVLPKGQLANPPLRVPVVRISAAAGEQLLAEYGAAIGVFNDDSLGHYPLPGRAHLQVSLQAPQRIQLNSLVAYRPGTDADLGDEIVLFYAFCDGLWRSAEDVQVQPSGLECAQNYMMELARLLQENLIDMRRPVMFIVWGGGEFGGRELVHWVPSDGAFSITAPGMRLSPKVTIAIQLIGTTDGAAQLRVLRRSEASFIQLMQDAGREMGTPVSVVDTMPGPQAWFPINEVPYQGVLQVDMSAESQLAEEQGQALSFALIRLLREDILPGD